MSSACETDELLPCPFCGNGAEFKPYKRDGLTLKCQSLGCVSVNQRTLRYSLEWLKGKMIESWNTRATLSNMPAPIAQPVPPPLTAAQAVADELLEALKDACPYIDSNHLRQRIGALIVKATGAAS